MKSTDYLKDKNIEFKIIKLDEAPKTAQDVERIYGCPLHQVLKTIVFVGDKEPIIVILPGNKRVNINKLKTVTKQTNLQIAKPREVEDIIGYPIGAVSPFGIKNDIKIFIDQSIFETDTVNIGSGKAEIGIELDSKDLRKLLGKNISDIVD